MKAPSKKTLNELVKRWGRGEGRVTRSYMEGGWIAIEGTFPAVLAPQRKGQFLMMFEAATPALFIAGAVNAHATALLQTREK